ncbi:hypothetical protein QYE76_060232 [Lolium multiflorum]|uniref:Reverse transcriptase zinc-binding domain-containing protein n=1 Tax=Lolium multiflorum TaxID=4521 RepID=A0AAD8RYR8_LOLMU|nr:hypothetical protein QYE76_060232 [Lolium multiflorum]
MVLTQGIHGLLQPRLSRVAQVELTELTTELSSVVLCHDTPDKRVCRLTNKMLSNKDFYSNAFRHLHTQDLAAKVWRSAAPLKCKIFSWPAWKRRLPTNERRFRHRLADSGLCPSCPLEEDVDHLLLTCPRAREIWQFFNFDLGARGIAGFPALFTNCCRNLEETTVVTAILWNIWKRRNSLVFNNQDEPLMMVTRRCLADLRLWAHRCTVPTSASMITNWVFSFEPP